MRAELQVRTAFGVALALNRTLVLPRLLCGLETVTNFPHRGAHIGYMHMHTDAYMHTYAYMHKHGTAQVEIWPDTVTADTITTDAATTDMDMHMVPDQTYRPTRCTPRACTRLTLPCTHAHAHARARAHAHAHAH